jgi:putative ABC transport system substrate-binding protein
MKRRDLLILSGVSVAWPLVARAQQKAMPVIGYFSSADAASGPSRGFHQGLKKTGYIEGQNLAIEYRWAEGHYDRLPALASDLVGRKVEVIATIGMPAAWPQKMRHQRSRLSSMSVSIRSRKVWSIVWRGLGAT